MSTLIVYASKYGCAKKCATLLSKEIKDQLKVMDLKVTKTIDLTLYDKVIIGGSIYIGKIQKEVTEFCKQNLDVLKTKQLGLYICGMQDNDTLGNELKANFPEELYNHATAREYFGGEFIFDLMSFFDKFIVKKIVKVSSDTYNIIVENVDQFAKIMSKS